MKKILAAALMFVVSCSAISAGLSTEAPAGAQAPFALSKTVSDKGVLNFTLPGGDHYSIQTTLTQRYGARRWIGQDNGNFVVLVDAGGIVSGTLRSPKGSFVIRGPAEDAVLLSQSNVTKTGLVQDAVSGSFTDLPPVSAKSLSKIAVAKSAAVTPTFDILVFYTTALASSVGQHAVESDILSKFAAMETAFANGQLGYQPNLVGIEPYVLDETQSLDDSLTTFGHDSARVVLRQAYGADTTALVRSPIAGSTVIGIGGEGAEDTDSHGVPNGHFLLSNASIWEYNTSAEVLAHEVGHNLGAHHPYGSPNGTGPGWKPYAAGFTCGSGHGDLMSPEYGTPLLWYSTSRVFPAIPSDVSPCGTADSVSQPADNERAIREALPDAVLAMSPPSQDATVTLSVASATVNDSAGHAVITVTRSGTLSADRSVNVVTQSGTGVGGMDYQWVSTNVAFATGASQAVVNVPVIKRGAYHGDTNFVVGLRFPKGVSLGAVTSETVTVKDTNTAPPLPTVVGSPMSQTISAGTLTITFHVTNADACSADLTGPGGLSMSYGNSALTGVSTFSHSIMVTAAGTYSVTATCTNAKGSVSGTATATVTALSAGSSSGGGAFELETLFALLCCLALRDSGSVLSSSLASHHVG